MLRLSNIKKSFVEPGGTKIGILDVPRFEMAKGEQMVLIGPSGCGKTTLLHVIAGIRRPDSGSVEVAGLDITQLPEAGCDRFRADNIGYVFQTFNLLPAFTALENVVLGMRFGRKNRDPSRARQLLDRVGLAYRMDHKPGTMSVGEQQRVALARALANLPRLLLADEPTANVDPANKNSIVNLLTETCREEEITLLVVTHDMVVSERFQRIDRLEEINLAATTAASVEHHALSASMASSVEGISE
ncbi:MAG: ABC transporter ATP-binding protein [Pirellulales bacterium]|nr:ABC transporter ATP-binding protein [Pirellulales bacterium]